VLPSRRAVLRNLFVRVLSLHADPIGNRLTALEVQEELIKRIVSVERLIRASKATVSNCKRELATPSQNRTKARQTKARLQRAKAQLSAHNDFLEMLRTIGDAVAFTFGDRFDLKPLAFREASGFIGGKRGARLERAILRMAFDRGLVAILNDLTHTLRFGDVTVFRPDGTFMIVEAKSGRGGKYSRNQRQIAAIREMAAYIETDVRQEAHGEWRRVALKSNPSDHAAHVTQMAQALVPGGWVAKEVEPGLHYFIIDGSDNDALDPAGVFGALDKTKRYELLSVNDMKYERMGYTPFPLLIRDPDLLCRFFAGEFVINILVCIDRVNELLAVHGLEVTPGNDSLMHWRVHDKADVDLESFVSAHLVGRLAAEFVSLEWLVESIANSQQGFRDVALTQH
jgi:hypothetical protein